MNDGMNQHAVRMFYLHCVEKCPVGPQMCK